MGILSAPFVEVRAHPSTPPQWLLDMGLQPTAAGMNVTTEGALKYSAVFACVRVLAESVASLPLVLYRRLDRGKERATDHPLYKILHDLANSEMTSYELRETMMTHLGLWGNGYAEIEFNRAGEVAGLWPLRPDRMKVQRRNGRLWYVYRMPAGASMAYVELPFSRIMHLRGLSLDGVIGYSPIDLARQSIGLGLGTEEFGARFFGNGAQTGTIYEHPTKLSDTAYERLKKSIERRHQGLERAHRIMILEEGMTAKQVSIAPDNAQFLETRKFQVRDVARWYRMPPHKIGDLEQATFSNIEHQGIEFVTDTISPWAVRFEQGIYRDLLTESERMIYFAEHLVDALLRGDMQGRYQAYAQGRQNGWLSANDIREKENMNPVEGGDVYLVPLNMVPADEIGERMTRERSAAGHEHRSIAPDERRARNLVKSRQRLAKSYRRVLLDAAERVVRREIADVRRAIRKFFGKRDAQQFSLWLKEFYDEHTAFWQRQILPILLAYADQVGASVADELGGEPPVGDDIRAFIDQYVEALAARQAGESHLQLRALLDKTLQEGEDDPAEVLEARLDEWEEKRADKVAREESRSALHAMVLAFYVLAGVVRYRWVASGENCPYCRALDGKIVGIQEVFVAKDEDFEPEGAERPIRKRHHVKYPPLHGGCDCTIRAER